MSKPSVGKRSVRKRPKRSPEAVSPETKELRVQVRAILPEIRALAQSVEVLTRQKYTPEILLTILERYLNLFPEIASLANAVADQPVSEEDKDLQTCITNAAAVMLFFQAPILDGVFSEKSPGAVLREFIEVVNTSVKEGGASGGPDAESPHD